MTLRSKREYLGVGWKFPLQVTPGGKIAQAREEQRVEESIYLILSTSKGERPMLPEFGCGIHDLVFAPNNVGTQTLVAFHVEESLYKWEPRIRNVQVEVAGDEHQQERILVDIRYEIRSTNAVANLVFPFYLTGS